jgi:hypothetical protein
MEYSVQGVPTDFGADWSMEAINAARAAGPNAPALTYQNTTLVGEEVQCQVDAGFVRTARVRPRSPNKHEDIAPRRGTSSKLARSAHLKPFCVR